MSEVTLSANAQKIMDLVKDLTIVELNDLVKAMEEEFGVSAAASVMVAAAWAGAEEEEKSKFTVVLTNAGASKIGVIKIIREITGLGLKEAKDLADNGWNIKEDVSKDEAEDFKSQLIAWGASVEIK